jgi:hypothetical protein
VPCVGGQCWAGHTCSASQFDFQGLSELALPPGAPTGPSIYFLFQFRLQLQLGWSLIPTTPVCRVSHLTENPQGAGWRGWADKAGVRVDQVQMRGPGKAAVPSSRGSRAI